MSVRIYSTLTGREDELVPLHPDGVLRMYVCGMTPKFHPHVGHARVVRGHGRHPPLSRCFAATTVKYVQNFTDIDDKIIERAAREGRDADATAQAYIDSYFEVMDRLNVRRADEYPTVTGYMERIVEFIAGLVETDHAYPSELGDVYFDVVVVPRVRQAQPPRSEQPARGGAQGARARQARPARLRAVEARPRGRAVAGPARGAAAAPAGTSSARPWCAKRSATRSTSTAAAPT